MTTSETVTGPTAWAGFDRWASVVLMSFAVIEVAVAILVAPGIREPLLVGAVFCAGLAAAATHLIAVSGLSMGRPWARPAAVMLLWLAIIIGLVQLVTALSSGSLNIPLGAIAAALVLRRRPADRSPWPEGRWGSMVAVLALFLFSLALPPAANYLLQPGRSPFSVAPDSLALTAGLVCDGRGGAPTKVSMTATWKWDRAELLPHGTDALAFRWQTSEPASDGSLSPRTFVLDDAPGTGFSRSGQGATDPRREGATGYFWLGDAGPDDTDLVMSGLLTDLQASDDLARSVTRRHHEGVAETVMIDVDRQRLRDDTFAMVLAADRNAHLHGTLTVDVGYVHAGRWMAWSDAVSCSL